MFHESLRVQKIEEPRFVLVVYENGRILLCLGKNSNEILRCMNVGWEWKSTFWKDFATIFAKMEKIFKIGLKWKFLEISVLKA